MGRKGGGRNKNRHVAVMNFFPCPRCNDRRACAQPTHPSSARRASSPWARRLQGVDGAGGKRKFSVTIFESCWPHSKGKKGVPRTLLRRRLLRGGLLHRRLLCGQAGRGVGGVKTRQEHSKFNAVGTCEECDGNAGKSAQTRKKNRAMSPPYLGGLRGSSSLLDHGHFGAVGRDKL